MQRIACLVVVAFLTGVWNKAEIIVAFWAVIFMGLLPNPSMCVELRICEVWNLWYSVDYLKK